MIKALTIKKLTVIELVLIFVISILSPRVVYAEEIGNKKVLFDETRLQQRSEGGYFDQISETNWYGGSFFANNLTDMGFEVSSMIDKPIIYESLQKYNILIILSSNDNYLGSEIDAIEEFVRNGGGLLIVQMPWKGDDDYSTNAIAKRFGVSFAENGTVLDPLDHLGNETYYQNIPRISDLVSYDITKDVSSFYMSGTYIKDIGSSSVLAKTNQEAYFDKFRENWGNNQKDSDELGGPFPVLSHMRYGNGKIIFFGDSGILFTNGLLDSLDNKQLALNIVKWLSFTDAPKTTNGPTPKITAPITAPLTPSSTGSTSSTDPISSASSIIKIMSLVIAFISIVITYLVGK